MIWFSSGFFPVAPRRAAVCHQEKPRGNRAARDGLTTTGVPGAGAAKRENVILKLTPEALQDASQL